jgi:hypothetical protein
MVISFNRIAHWAILYATAPLPKSWRVRARKAWLARLQRRMLAKADVLIIRHPKTGGTWFRVLLSSLYAQKYGTSDRRVFKAEELHLQNRALPRFLNTSGTMSWEHVIADAFAEGSPLLDGKKHIFICRHPGDVVVSWHRQYQNRTKAFKRELLEAEMPGTVDWQALDRWAFIQRPELGLPSLIEYQNFWAEHVGGRDDGLIVRYEDLRRDTFGELRRVADFLGESFTDEQIRQAIEFGSVENLRRLEHEGYFQNNSLRLRDAGNPDTFKVRRAKVGGFREDLTAEQADWVQAEIDRHCHPALGYATVPTSDPIPSMQRAAGDRP